MPLPKFSEEEIKEMKKAQKEAEKAARSAAKAAPKYRSLHYIDDEDYDSLPELKTEGKTVASGDMDIPEIKD
jgi:predicted CopG family antitoxin